jgi:hypothetical protein
MQQRKPSQKRHSCTHCSSAKSDGIEVRDTAIALERGYDATAVHTATKREGVLEQALTVVPLCIISIVI